MRKTLAALALSLVTATGAFAGAGDIPSPIISCGGSFSSFVGRMKDLAVSRGHDRATVDRFFSSVRQDSRTLGADGAQGIFTSGFVQFSRKLISQNRMDNGRRKMKQYASVFDAVERRFGVSRGVLTAFWAFETDFGAFQGDFNTLNSLMTLSHDCRRPGLFQPQVLAALDLYNMLRKLGWRANEPWLQEVTLPQGFDYSKTGIHQKMSVKQWANLGVTPRSGRFDNNAGKASIIVPQGHKGPAFIAYPNFDVYFEWNQSFTYVLTAAYFATRLEGAPVYNAGNAPQALSGKQMKSLQKKLRARGYDVGKIDGILGAKTRLAVQAEQARLGLVPDAWPTVKLLNSL